MRIAIIGNFGLGYKGTMAARAVPIGVELARRGHEVAMFLPGEAAPRNDVPLPPELRLVEAGLVRDGMLPRRALGHLSLGLRLTARALRFRPDVVYAFKPKGYAGMALLVSWWLRRAGLVRVGLAVDADDWEGAGGWADREPGPPGARALVTWHERWCLRHADVVTAASRELVALAGRDAARIVYAPNAASPASPGWEPGDRTAGRAALGLGDAPVVLAYTRFVEFAPRRLVDVFARVRDQVPEARLVVAGRGLGGEDAEFARLVNAAGLADSVRQLGWVGPAALPDRFAAADVALYPLDDTLLNRAKCPMKLVDLLLAGVPVVADRVGQAAEYVVDGASGCLVPSGDVAAMAEAAAGLLRDPERARSLGAAARERLRRCYTWEKQAAAIAVAFERLGCSSG